MKDIFLKEIYIKVQYFKKAGGVFFKTSLTFMFDKY